MGNVTDHSLLLLLAAWGSCLWDAVSVLALGGYLPAAAKFLCVLLNWDWNLAVSAH